MTWYATREDVRSAMGSASTARSDAQLDRALAAATRSVSELCQRDFAPVLDTRYFDWPNSQTPRAWRLWLDRNDLLSATSITSGGTAIPPSDYYLEPANYGPPYTRVEIRLDRQSAWAMGATHQRAIAITGWYAGAEDVQAPAGQLVTSIDTSQTTLTVPDAAVVGVGDLLAVGTERMTVTDRALADTGQTLQGAVTAKKEAALLTVADGTALHRGETLTVDAERVLVRDIAGSAVIVDRAVDGTALAAHDAGAALWAPRLLSVARGSAGTTAATAAGGTPISRWVAPSLVHTLTVAESMSTLLQEQAGYARTVRSQAGTGTRSVAAVTVELDALRQRVYQAHGRQARIRVV